MEQQASFVCKTRRRHALTLTLTCRLSRSLSLTTDLKPCSKPNRNQVQALKWEVDGARLHDVGGLVHLPVWKHWRLNER